MKQDETRGLTKRNLIKAYVLIATAKTDEQYKKAYILAESSASRLKKYEVRNCWLEAKNLIKSNEN